MQHRVDRIRDVDLDLALLANVEGDVHRRVVRVLLGHRHITSRWNVVRHVNGVAMGTVLFDIDHFILRLRLGFLDVLKVGLNGLREASRGQKEEQSSNGDPLQHYCLRSLWSFYQTDYISHSRSQSTTTGCASQCIVGQLYWDTMGATSGEEDALLRPSYRLCRDAFQWHSSPPGSHISDDVLYLLMMIENQAWDI